MDLILFTITVLVLVAFVVLIYAMSFQVRRRWRMRQFAFQRGARFSTYDTFDVGSRLASLDLPRSAFVGAGLARQTTERDFHVFDVHHDADGPPRKTCCLLVFGRRRLDESLVIQSRFPPGDERDHPEASTGFERHYRLGGDSTFVPPAALREILVDHTRRHQWLVELRWNGSMLLVCSHGRSLHDPDEWDALVETTERCARVLKQRAAESSQSGDPR